MRVTRIGADGWVVALGFRLRKSMFAVAVYIETPEFVRLSHAKSG